MKRGDNGREVHAATLETEETGERSAVISLKCLLLS